MTIFIFLFFIFWHQDYLCDIAYVHMAENQPRRAPGAAPHGVPRLAGGAPFTQQSKGAGWRPPGVQVPPPPH
jgi:hypothetical protein